MSRGKCVEGAHAIKEINLLHAAPKPKPDDTEGEYAMMLWEEEDRERQEKARAIERRRQELHRMHLQRFMPELGELEAYQDINSLLMRGMAYHHAGMLPILREYVELCFQERLVRVVFATETLAVGVNMPARTVVFSQLDKPDHSDDGNSHRWLRTDEFWQMAGRAGRRGMDVRGFVIYSPRLSVAGLKNKVDMVSLKTMLTGVMPAATSQLVVDRPFVLRHLSRGHGPEVLTTTLKSDELQRQRTLMEHELGDEAGVDDATRAVIDQYNALMTKLEGGDTGTGLAIKLNPKQRKKVHAEVKELADGFPGGASALDALRAKVKNVSQMAADIDASSNFLRGEWDRCIAWLKGEGFLEEVDPETAAANGGCQYRLPPRGRACAAFADGHPLIVGTVIADGGLDALSLPEICAFLCLFLREARAKDCTAAGLELPRPSDNLQKTFAYADGLAQYLGVELDKQLSFLMLDWCERKDITRIAQWIDPHLLGTFVKAVMRVVSYIDIVREVLLGLGKYEVHNRLDNHMDALLGGLVTNESLYLNMAAI